MTAGCPRWVTFFIIGTIAASFATGPALHAHAQAQQEELSAVGRLATVEPRVRRLTMVVEGDTKQTEVVLAEDGEIYSDNDAISLAELVTLVGNRITISYRVEDGVWVARRLNVERAAPPRTAASDPTPRA